MFPEKTPQKTQTTTNIEKKFLGIHKSTNYLWWKEPTSYLFIPASQITEVKLVTATNGSYNVYARVNLLDRFEYFLIDNKKTIVSAKKLAEDFIEMIQGKSVETPSSKKKTKEEKKAEPPEKEDLNGADALVVLLDDLKPD